jgi:hypothetical protein
MSNHLEREIEKQCDHTRIRGLTLLYLRFVQRTETGQLRRNELLFRIRAAHDC